MKIDMSTGQWIGAVTALLAITNGGQFMGTTKPAQIAESEAILMQEAYRDDLKECHAQLRECYKECTHTSRDHVTGSMEGPWTEGVLATLTPELEIEAEQESNSWERMFLSLENHE